MCAYAALYFGNYICCNSFSKSIKRKKNLLKHLLWSPNREAKQAFLGLRNAFQKLQFLPRALALEAMEVEAVNEGQQLPLVGEEHILIVQRLRDNCATRKSMCC